MKKVKDRKRHIRNKERIERKRWKRRKRLLAKGLINSKGKLLTKKKGKSSKRLKWKTVSSGQVLSLEHKPEDTLKFFERIHKHISKKHAVYIDLSQVKVLGPEVILYMLSRFSYFQNNYKNYAIQGNAPSDPYCSRLLQASGFYKYVAPINGAKHVGHSSILDIRSGTKVEPKTALDVTNFAQNCLGVSHSLRSSSVYVSIIECMANTLNHAYSKKTDIDSKWWMMASEIKKKNGKRRVRFIFLDNGMTIPKTVQTKFQKFFSFRDDTDVLKKTLDGQFRSSTRLKGRGKGLPKIKEFYMNGNIQDLKVVSRKGVVNFQWSYFQDTKQVLQGTILIWDFTEK